MSPGRVDSVTTKNSPEVEMTMHLIFVKWFYHQSSQIKNVYATYDIQCWPVFDISAGDLREKPLDYNSSLNVAWLRFLFHIDIG